MIQFTTRLFRALSPFFTLFSLSCSHTFSTRASHFAVPFVADEQWGGHIGLVAAPQTRITLINNINSNPPNRTTLDFQNDSLNSFFSGILPSLDASLHIWHGLEIFADGSLMGFRQQFLNHAQGPHKWVASVQGCTRSISETTTASNSSATSKILTTQAGISLGYKYSTIVPYFSYIYEYHEATTNVVNASGAFGPYKDIGNHQYYTVGFSSRGKGLKYTAEYNLIAIQWDRPESKTQNSAGFKLGYEW